MEANKLAVRVTPIKYGGVTIYFPREFPDDMADLLPHDDPEGTRLKSYQVIATYIPGKKQLVLSRL
jgi:hypothetical protein